jgi:microcystin-dependent protein
MGTPFMSEVKIITWNFPPKGWAFCNGQQLPINQNQALFSLMGTMYGGNGQTTFALPDLRGRVPIHIGGSFNVEGQAGGQSSHTLTMSEMTGHFHTANSTNDNGSTGVPTGALLARATNFIYETPVNFTALNAAAVSSVGGSQAHSNMQPYLVLNYVIALVGVFPSRN